MSKYLDKLKRILVLTPDSIGSTYFQRSLTVYLNWHGHSTKNYHELAGFTNILSDLVENLSVNPNNIIATCSPYRSLDFDQTENYLKFCKYFFTNIYVIDRCSFESALSYCNTWQPDKPSPLNVYSKHQYLENKNKKPYSITTNNFIDSLKYFEDFYVWVDKYFPNSKKIKHLDLISNPDKLFEQEFNISSNKELSLKEYNKFNTLRIRNKDLNMYTATELLKFIELSDYIDFLVQKDLLASKRKFPFKKITLSEKIKDIDNFTELLDVYNNYPSNHFKKVTKDDITNRVKKEYKLWTI